LFLPFSEEVFHLIKLKVVPDCSVASILLTALTAFTGIAAPSAASAANSQPYAAASCEVSTASLTWGFKESFRSYISGNIANGKWTVADGAEYSTPNFSWPDGSGPFDASAASGSLVFTGSIEFTGHGGILDTTVANPRVRFAGAQAILDLDVDGTTQQGKPISEKSVPFAALDLSKAAIRTDGGTVTIAKAPADLTAEGASAFGTYKSGETLDPVTVSFVTSEACAKAFIANEKSAEGAGMRILLGVVIGAGALLVIAAIVLVWRRRMRASQHYLP
jgi:Htaa